MGVELDGGRGLPDILKAGRQVEQTVPWTVIEDYPENMILGQNLRPRNDEHVIRIAESIASQGQLQECVGDTVAFMGKVRIWAGQHRYMAVELINKKAQEAGVPPLKLRVRVYPGEFSPEKIFEIQLAENLHHEMRPEEEAEAIEYLWSLYNKLFEKSSVLDLAERTGRGEAKVRNALKFSGLDAPVRKLVEGDALLYSIAVELAKLPREKQLNAAMRIVMYNLDRSRSQKLIAEMIGGGEQYPLFGNMQDSLEQLNHIIAFRTTADRSAKDASGYFKRILRLIQLMEDPTRAEITEPIREILTGLIGSSDDFRRILKEASPHLADKIEGLTVNSS